MTGIEKYNSPAKVQRLGNDSVYGMGNDGNVTIAANTVLSRDMYYNNLTINSNCNLNTNGFRVFVKGTMTLNGNIGVGSTDTVSTGTVAGQTPASSNASYSLGGNAYGNTYTVSALPTNLIQDIEKAVAGIYADSSGTVITIAGGAGGGTGAPGTVTPGANGSGAGSGGSGGLPSRATGQPGGPGTPGTNGVAGSTPPAASGGAGAAGGPVVIVVAKTITGSGSILSQGKAGSAGGSSATGTGATNGAAGTTSPGETLTHLVDGSASYPYPNNNSPTTTTVSVPNLPHGGHTPYIYNYYYGYTYRYVHVGNVHHNGLSGHYDHGHAGGGGPYGHHYGDFHTPTPSTSSYFAQNGIDHTTPHRNHSGVAHSGYSTHYSGSYNTTHDAPHYGVHVPPGGYPHVPGQHHTMAYPRQHHDNSHWQYIYRNAGTVSTQGSQHFAGGAGGSAGTNGTNGSTTAGEYGQSGGGGGIIIITDSIANTVSTSTIGGTANGNTASSGSVVTIINT